MVEEEDFQILIWMIECSLMIEEERGIDLDLTNEIDLTEEMKKIGHDLMREADSTDDRTIVDLRMINLKGMLILILMTTWSKIFRLEKMCITFNIRKTRIWKFMIPQSNPSVSFTWGLLVTLSLESSKILMDFH